mmetsp:Transcript_34148/g.96990  ORF Transcript_34148/g.96990 Transcript_34148/m.96990 type:complete len:253 (+) Transcript_34148:96-854(+)
MYRSGAAIALMGLALAVPAAASVDCGGHYASECSACPQGNGESWCHGDCTWSYHVFHPSSSECVPQAEKAAEGLVYLTIFAATAFLMLIFACVYQSQVVEKIGTLPDEDSFDISGRERGLFECFKEPQTLLHVIFCFPVVAAKNYNAAEVLGFWPGCILTFVLTHIPGLYCVNVLARGFLSWKVDTRLGRERGPVKSCLINLFCMPCDVGRESLQVDDELGATITCCCNASVCTRIVTEASNAKSRLCTPSA